MKVGHLCEFWGRFLCLTWTFLFFFVAVFVLGLGGAFFMDDPQEER